MRFDFSLILLLSGALAVQGKALSINVAAEGQNAFNRNQDGRTLRDTQLAEDVTSTLKTVDAHLEPKVHLMENRAANLDTELRFISPDGGGITKFADFRKLIVMPTESLENRFY